MSHYYTNLQYKPSLPANFFHTLYAIVNNEKKKSVPLMTVRYMIVNKDSHTCFLHARSPAAR